MKEGSASFLPRPPPGNDSNTIHDFPLINPQINRSEQGMIRYPCLVAHHLPGRDARMIQDLQTVTNHSFRIAPNIVHNANLFQRQFLSSGEKRIQDFHLPTNQQLANSSHLIQHSHLLHLQLSANELSIPQQSCLLPHKLPSIRIGMNQNSNMFIQQAYRCVSGIPQFKHSPNRGLSQIEPGGNQIKVVQPHQQWARESAMRQGLQSIFQHHSKDGSRLVQNPYMSGHQTVGNPIACPSSNLPEIGFNVNREVFSVQRDLVLSKINLNSNLYPQYSENLHICLVGPPGCGKTDLTRTFARNDTIPIPTGKPLRKAFQQGMVCFGTNLIIDVWHAEDLTQAAEDLKALCESSKSVLVLVYRIAHRDTLSTVLEWIKLLKRDITANVPIILLGNNTDVKSSFNSGELSGARVQEEYGLSAFYQCSTECVDDVEAVFLLAAHKALYRKVQRPVFEP